MFLRPYCVRTASASPLSCLSRTRPAIMPLKARVMNSAFGVNSNMSTTSEDIKPLPGDEPDDVVFNSLYGVRTVELNRPKKLNSLNASMARKIFARLREWEKSDLINCVMITGAGPKAFCAGGDVAALALQNKKGPKGQQESTDYFALEYKLDHLIATYPKPYIAVMDGITMGGGVGLSVHAPFRIATERTLFAMPETTIGLFPDVGGSFFLSRLDGSLGPYLALTSERLQGVQAFYHGIATHYMHSSTLAECTNRLAELVFQDDLNYQGRLKLINDTINEYATALPPQEPIALSGEIRKAIDSVFALPTTVSKVLSNLEGLAMDPATSEPVKTWATKTRETMMGRSPMSMAITLRQLTLGRGWTISETFKREHALAARFMRHPDFTEGVTARLIEKPPREPSWSPATPGTVSDRAVDEFFQRPSDVEPLQLPNEGAMEDYKKYPHRWTALPPENDIEGFGRGTGVQTEREIIKEFLERTGNKVGVEEKVKEVLARLTTLEDGKLQWHRIGK